MVDSVESNTEDSTRSTDDKDPKKGENQMSEKAKEASATPSEPEIKEGVAEAKEEPKAPETHSEKPAEKPAEKPVEKPAETHAEKPAETPVDRESDSFKEEISKIRADYDNRIKLLEERARKQEQLIHFKECSEVVAQFMEDGKSVPAMKDDELNFVLSLSKEQLVKYAEIKKAQPKVIEYGVKGTVEAVKPGTGVSDAKQEAKELLAGIGYTEKDGKMQKN